MQETTTTITNSQIPENITEEWFLDQIEKPDADTGQLINALRLLAGNAGPEKADACAELWMEQLIAQRKTDDLIRLLGIRAEWQEGVKFRGVCRDILMDYFRVDTVQQTLITNSGFYIDDLPASEALRRLTLLRSLRPGLICYDKTWGAGELREVSDYDQKIAVDFPDKPGHRLAMSHAAANLRVLPEENILARLCRDRDAAQKAIKDDPEKAMREVLTEFGPFSITRLQEWVTTNLLPESDWKAFWDAARKKLKADPRVTLPTRRTELIVLRAQARINDAQWLEDFRQERDFEKIFRGLEEMLTDTNAKPESPEIAALTSERLQFILKYASNRDHPARARAFLWLMGLPEPPPANMLTEHAAILLTPAVFKNTLTGLPVRSQALFCRHLHKLQPETARAVLLDNLAALEVGVLGEVIRALMETGEIESAVTRLRELLQSIDPPLDIVAWLCRNLDFREQHALSTPARLAFMAINLLENPAMAGVGRTRARNQLRDCLHDTDWLADAFSAMDAQQRRDFALRLKTAALAPGEDNAAMLLRIINLHPELEDVLREPVTEEAPASLTSHRTYRERQEQLQKLVNEEIPANSREIGIARSYGDLRENFEYKSAKETQGILMRRRGELEQMLGKVHPSDFAGIPTDRAGPGTTVTLRHTDGTEETYSILGEWDHDVNLGIIPNRSRLAEILRGHQAGEKLEIPDEDGEQRETVITAISEMPPPVRAWINGKDI